MRYKISDLAKILNVSTNTVRRYESKGYLTSIRDHAGGYRYYSGEDLFRFINARLLRKYGFTHEQLDEMKTFDLDQTIVAYEQRMDLMDRQIAYMSNVRHRIKDDLLLMKKAECMQESVYEKPNVELYYVLYEENERILTEKKRLETMNEFINASPEVQRIYIVRKKEIDRDRFQIDMGWAVKQMHMEKYNLHENEYTEHYEQQPSVMGIIHVPIPVSGSRDDTAEQIQNQLEKNHFAYMKEHGLRLAGDLVGIIITRATVGQEDMQYILFSAPCVVGQ